MSDKKGKELNLPEFLHGLHQGLKQQVETFAKAAQELRKKETEKPLQKMVPGMPGAGVMPPPGLAASEKKSKSKILSKYAKKTEFYIDNEFENDPKKRQKLIGDKNTVTPDDKASKEAGSDEGSGGKITAKTEMAKADGMSAPGAEKPKMPKMSPMMKDATWSPESKPAPGGTPSPWSTPPPIPRVRNFKKEELAPGTVLDIAPIASAVKKKPISLPGKKPKPEQSLVGRTISMTPIASAVKPKLPGSTIKKEKTK